VGLTFQSLISSSGGNCLVLSSGSTTILIDCGFKTQRDCRAMLDQYASKITGVLVTHAHGDHICYSALKVLQEYGATVHCHPDVAPHVHRKHIRRLKSPLELTAFPAETIGIGDFEVLPVALPHEPRCPTFGFVIRCGEKKVVVCTDFHDPAAIRDHLVDADFIFLEANHDLELLKRFPNYASHYHLSNNKSAQLICHAIRHSRRPPQHVMLGHLSEQRNSDERCLQTMHETFFSEFLAPAFPLHTAPRRTASDVLSIN
jgi:phosphoribosyl 1,2-cyclic phosphodiesterase